MFPSRFSNALAGLLDVAEAMLAPLPADQAPAARQRHRSSTAAPQAHPTKAVTSTRQRRPAPLTSAHACVSPVPARRPDAGRAHATR